MLRHTECAYDLVYPFKSSIRSVPSAADSASRLVCRIAGNDDLTTDMQIDYARFGSA